MDNIDVINYHNADIAFYSSLIKILGDEQIDGYNFEQKIKKYIEKKKLNGFGKTIFELLLYVNPKTNSFKSDINRLYIFKILDYLEEITKNKNTLQNNEKAEDFINNPNEPLNEDQKVNDENNDSEENHKQEINVEEIYELFMTVSQADELYRNLFIKIEDISKKEQYLDMILFFLPEKDTEQIIKVIDKNLDDKNKSEIISLFRNVLQEINLKTELGFMFLSNILLKFLDDKNNIIQGIKEIKAKYLFKNNEGRCTKCSTIPIFSFDAQNNINISYKCGHNLNNINNYKDIMEYKFKCDCNKDVLEYKKNYICSKCKNIVCHLCLQEHFNNCGTIFFILFNEIDNKCLEHNENYEFYCELCELNLCKKCCQEHYHKVETYNNDLNDKEYDQFLNIIKSNEKNNKNVLLIIENSIKTIKKKKNNKNFQFLHFVKKILKKDSNIKSKLFDELYGDDFKKYYNFMITQIESGNYYYLKVLKKFMNYYSDKTINTNYSLFLNTNIINSLTYQVSTMNNNSTLFALFSKYFNILYDIKTQKQLLQHEIEIRKTQISNEENKLLIKKILYTESLYQKELLKLIIRSIAESIIVYLIEKFPNNFKKIDLNLNIYADLEKYFKDNKDKFEKIKNDNIDIIKSFINDSLENNNENNEKNYKMAFDKSVNTKKSSIKVDDLNTILEYLFSKKEEGNLTAHPNNTQNTAINPIKHKIKIIKDNDNINTVKNTVENLLKEGVKKKSFITKVKPKAIFDCLFDSKFKPLINSQDNNEMNDKIENIIKELFNKTEELVNVKNIFENYTEKMAQLKTIYNKLNKKYVRNDKQTKVNESLVEFFKRFDKLLNNDQKILPFLDDLNESEYENCVTGEYYTFFSMCLNYMIIKLLPKIKDKLEAYEKDKQELETLIQSKEQIRKFLCDINQNVNSIDEFYEPCEKFDELVKNDNNNLNNENIDLTKIRDNLGKLVTNEFDWTIKRKCKLSTLLFLKQNNY